MADRFTLQIGGDDVVCRVGTLKISRTLNGVDTLTCEALSLDASTRYAVGDEVIAEDDELGGDRIFGGNITTQSEHVIDDQLIEEFALSVSAVDFNAIADRRTVIGGGIPAGFTLKQAIVSLAGYLAAYGVTVDPAQVDGPPLPLMQYDVKRVSAWFNELTVITGFVWEIDYNKVLRFIEPGTVAAPFFIADDDGNTVGDIIVDPSDAEFANRVIVLAGDGQREVTEALTFNGSDDFVDLTYTLVGHRGYLTVNASDETLGGSPAIWVFDPLIPNRIKREAGAPGAGSGSITYTAQFPYIAQADDGISQAGPRGIVDTVIKKADVFEATLAQAFADGYLLRMVTEPRIVRFSTHRPGLHPGQTLSIVSSVRNISLIALITDVVSADIDGETMRHDVTAVEGDIYTGSWRDLWRTMTGGAGGGGSSAAVSAPVTVIGSGGIGGAGTPGSLVAWATAATLTDATAVPSALLTGTIAAGRLPQFAGGDVITSGAGSVVLTIQSGVIFDTHVNAAAAIAWTKISKTGSSLSDLTTRSAGDLTSGNLAYARMPTGSGTWSASPTISGDTTFGGLIGTSSYVSQATGWRVTSAGEADFRYLFVDEMHAKSFIADLEQALAGGQIIAKSVTMVATAFTMPATGGSVTVRVRDLPSAPNMAVFEVGDRVIFRTFSRAAGALTIADAVGFVDTYVDGSGANEGTQTWGFNRDSGTNGGTMPTGTVVPVDSIVLDMGVSGNGYYEVNAIDGIYGVNSPYAQVVTWTTTPAVANRVVRARLGNLKGITSVAEYGFFAGDFANHAFVRFSDQAAQIRGIPVELYDGSTNTVRMNPTVPSIALGNPLPSAYGTGTGIWMGKDSSSYKFRVGNPSADRMTWDGSTLTVVGTLTATSGTIGNFTITSTTLASAGVDLNSAGAIHVGGSSGDALWISALGGAPHRIWIGDLTASTSIWYVNANGLMYARDGLILGPTSVAAVGLTFEESATHPTAPTAGSAVRVYMKSDKLVVQYNLGGTAQYFWLDLTSGSGTWSFSTSAP